MASREQRELRAALRDAEREMTALFDGLAREIGQVVMRYAGPDGTVPEERLGQVQAEARRLVSRAIVGDSRLPFDEENRPRSAYARILERGQMRLIDFALEEEAKRLRRVLPEDLRAALAQRWARRLAGGQ